jgi:nitrogen-specific signal transduction histidine kinase
MLAGFSSGTRGAGNMSLRYQRGNYKIDIEIVIDNLPSAIIVVDRDRRVRLANQAAVRFAQKSKQAFLGLRGGEAFGCINCGKSAEGCGYATECSLCKIKQAVLETFENRKGQVAVEAEMELLQMGQVPVRISTNFLELETQELTILAIEDVTEHKMQEQIRIENARLRAATETAAAVCHEMGQPLMAMTGLLDLLTIECDNEDRNLIETVKEQASRLGNISRKLMSLKSYHTKNYSGQKQILDLEASN